MKVLREPPVVAEAHAEPAVFDLAWLSAIGTATFLAGFFAGPVLGLSVSRTLRVFFRTCYRMRFSMIAILAMLGLGFVTRYSGMDAVMGLAMTNTGVLFPFFGTLLGWLAVALTGTDAGSNALFGSLQVITANKLALSPPDGRCELLRRRDGKDDRRAIHPCRLRRHRTGRQRGPPVRAVLAHSIVLAAIVGLIVTAYAYVVPHWVPSGHSFG